MDIRNRKTRVRGLLAIAAAGIVAGMGSNTVHAAPVWSEDFSGYTVPAGRAAGLYKQSHATQTTTTWSFYNFTAPTTSKLFDIGYQSNLQYTANDAATSWSDSVLKTTALVQNNAVGTARGLVFTSVTASDNLYGYIRSRSASPISWGTAGTHSAAELAGVTVSFDLVASATGWPSSFAARLESYSSTTDTSAVAGTNLMIAPSATPGHYEFSLASTPDATRELMANDLNATNGMFKFVLVLPTSTGAGSIPAGTSVALSNIQVSVPEPAALGLLSFAGLALLRRRHA